ncbi:MAG: hypothetical protein ABFE07_10955, partial [Armatimonadia bacterium]
WKLRGTNGYTSKMAVVETEVDGKPRHALRIDYNFNADRNPNGLNPGTKTVVIGCWIALPADTRKVRVTLGGDGSKHGLIVAVGEPADWFNFDAPPLTWQGTDSVEVDLQGRFRDEGGTRQNGKLDPPLFLSSVNLLQNPQGPATGTIQLVSVEAVTGPPSAADDLRILPWDTAETGVIHAHEVEQATLRVCNPSGTDVAGTLSWKISSPFGYTMEASQACNVLARQIVHVPLEGLPARCSYYDLDVRFCAGEAQRDKHLSLVVVPTLRGAQRARYGLGIMGAPPNLGCRWALALRHLGADSTAVTFDPAAEGIEQAADVGQLVAEVDAVGLQPVGCFDVSSKDFEAALKVLIDLQAIVTRYSGKVGAWCSPWFDTPDHTIQFAKFLAPDLRERLGHAAVILPLQAGNPGLWRGPENLLPDAAALFCDTFEANLLATPELAPEKVAGYVRTLYGDVPVQWGGIINCDRSLAGNVQPSLSERRLRDARGLALTLLEWSAVAGEQDMLLCPIVNAPLVNSNGNESRLFSEWSHPLPAAAAYATITSLLHDATSATRQVRDRLTLLSFGTPQGQVLAAWSLTDQAVELRLAITGPAWRLDFLGGRDDLNTGEVVVPIGPAPTYIEGHFVVAPE